MPSRVVPDIKTSAKIVIVGVGGSGGNAVNHMISQGIKGVDFIAANTDTQDLHKSKAEIKINLGKNATKGLGSGMDPDLGRQAAEESRGAIQEALAGADMVFIASGMGGGTGTGASPVIAEIARENDILTVAVVTKPFRFEGDERMRIAEEGIDSLKNEVDSLIIIPNDRLLELDAEEKLSFRQAFAACDEVLLQAVKGISDLINTPGIVNIDYADIKTILKNAGTAFMGVGTASGEDRASVAAEKAINSPLLDMSINGAKGVLFSIAGGEDLLMSEVESIANTITKNIDKNARVVFGATEDVEGDALKKGEIKVTVIATGFGMDSGGRSGHINKQGMDEIEDVVQDEEVLVKDDFYRDDLDIGDLPEDDELGDDAGSFPSFLRRGR